MRLKRKKNSRVRIVFYDEQFVLDFLREKHVLLVHGGGFNWANPDHFRIVYLPEVSVLTESMKKMDEFLEKYR